MNVKFEYDKDGMPLIRVHVWDEVEEVLPKKQHPVVVECEHGVVFCGYYDNGKWFEMDGYKVDSCNGDPVYSSFVEIPKEWKPIRWADILRR
jgi:hypothetical protein